MNFFFLELKKNLPLSPKRKSLTKKEKKKQGKCTKLKRFVPYPRRAHTLLPVERNTTTTTVSSLSNLHGNFNFVN